METTLPDTTQYPATTAATISVRPLSENHLPFLDGLRGLAALYIVIGHSYAIYRLEPAGYQPVDVPFFHLFAAGHLAVALFIVLSGFCLMLPVARSAECQLRGGAGRYFRRRAWRILPPYYAAMGLTLLMIALVPLSHHADGTFLNTALPVFDPGIILSHIFMVYNLHGAWIYKISPPFWSVAIEWQIYFLMPFLFLPLWRRFGAIAPIIAGLVVGLVPHYLLGSSAWSVSECHPWFAGLFAMGMAAAGACFAPTRGLVLGFLWRRAGTVTVVGIAAIGALILKTNWFGHKHVPFDVLSGLTAMGLLVWCQRQRSQPVGKGPVIRFLECRPIAFLGAISYSLYLMHAWVMFLLHRWTASTISSPAAALFMMTAVCIPLAIFFCWLFHLAFERPFLNSGPRKK